MFVAWLSLHSFILHNTGFSRTISWLGHFVANCLLDAMTGESGFFLLFRIFFIFTWLGISSVWKHKRKTSAKKLSGFFSEKKRAIQFTQDLYTHENYTSFEPFVFFFVDLLPRWKPRLIFAEFFLSKDLML